MANTTNSLKQYWPAALAILLCAILIGVNKTQNSFGLLFQSKEDRGQKTVDFINKNLLQGETAALGGIKIVSGVYEIKLKIGEQEYTSYITKDGKYLFTSGIDMVPSPSTEESETTAEATDSKKTCADLGKSNSPILEAFVVSKCPFGLQMQRILNEIVQNVPEAAQYIRVEYIGGVVDNKVTAMHGDEEAQENLRQVCIREEQGNNYWPYIDCHIKAGQVEPCLTAAGVDQVVLSLCMENPAKGVAYIQKDFDRANNFKATGSPTQVLNEATVSEFDFGGRTAEALKTVLCCGFNSQPGFCSQTLSSEQAATSFSETYASGGSASAGNCN